MAGRMRTRRLALLGPNSRVLILAKVRPSNLANGGLGLAVSALPAHGRERTGVEPLLRTLSWIRPVTPAPGISPRAGLRSAARPVSRGAAMTLT